MNNIGINMTNLNARGTALQTAGESFERISLSSVDTRSTITAVKNSMAAHRRTNQTHLQVGENLNRSATLIKDIGDRFFELDQDAARAMKL